MTELAALGLKADSSGLVKAAKDTRDLASAAIEAEKAAEAILNCSGVIRVSPPRVGAGEHRVRRC